MNKMHQIEDQYGLNLFNKRGISLNKGENCKVWDENGKEYIDCTSGHGVAIIGHSNPDIITALTLQASQLITCTGSFYNHKRAELMEKLISLSPPSLTRVFFCNSGTESIEAAIKFARFSSGKKEFITAMRGFHGRTMGSLSATYNPKYRQDFEPLVPGFNYVPFNNFEKLREAANEHTAGILLELVQGEGGVYIGDQKYFEQVKKLCQQCDILLIIDEVQTGFGRTGRLFACEHYEIEPDILCLSKGIAGGFPMGAVLCSDKIDIPSGKHGTTFGGNPLACAVALACIEYIIKHNLVHQAKEKGAYFFEAFNKHKLPVVREVRQIGLMIGIELKDKSQSYITKLQDEGVLVLPAGQTVIRLLPPLTIDKADIDRVVEKLVTILSTKSN